MRWFVSSKPEISWEVSFDLDPPLYLNYPHAKLPGSSAPKVTTISGCFKLTLEKAEHLEEMVSKITPKYHCRFHKEEDAGELPSIGCKIALNTKSYPAGVHDFPFIFEMPCDSWTRGFLGETMPNDSIKSSWQSVQWFALELRIVRKLPDGNLSTWKDEIPKRPTIATDELVRFYTKTFFNLTASLVDPGELPPPLERVIEEFAPQIGPVTIIVTSRSLTVSALANFTVTMPAVPAGSVMSRIRGAILSKATHTSLRTGGPDWVFPSERFYFVEQLPPFQTEESSDGSSYALSTAFAARLPHDREIFPTSHKHAVTPFRIANDLVIEIEVQDTDKRKQKITITEPLTIASCRLIHEWINLPPYGSAPMSLSKFQPSRPDQRVACACGFSLEQLMERESDGVVPDEAYQPPDLKGPDARPP